MRPGEDGRLYAINPEAGYFGVAPGTSAKSNPNALASIQRDTIFPNAAVTDDNQPWWEGLDDRVPVNDWQVREYLAGSGQDANHNATFPLTRTHSPKHPPQAHAPAEHAD